MEILTLIFTPFIVYTLWSLTTLVTNYRLARRTGLPILIHPIDSFNLPWLLARSVFNPLLRRLPRNQRWCSFAFRADIGWTFDDKYDTHALLQNDAFWIVTPGYNELYVADPRAAEEVMRRCRGPEGFVKRDEIYDALEVLGPSVNSVNGKVWERHRRITVPPFNERVSEGVWDEAGRQAEAAQAIWLAEKEVRSTKWDCMKIALHVLTRAGFGVGYDFTADDNKKDQVLPVGHEMDYREALRTIMNNMILVLVLRTAQRIRWPSWATWGRLRLVFQAHREFGMYLAEMVEEEKTRMRRGESDRGNLMSVLVRSSEESKGLAQTTGVATTHGLTDQEIYGNMFMYNAAGHDTTANTVYFALLNMAIHPEWQEWVAEQIDQITGAGREQDMVYEKVFPALTRCLALMYETLRLYGPVAQLPRWTADSWQRLSIGGRETMIPPKTNVNVNFVALHTHPRYWSPDPLIFRPDRWVLHDRSEPKNDSNEQQPYDWQSTSVLQPIAGSFVPWNPGPRVCPGKKFSQVEFVRVMATLFRGGSRVEIAREVGEQVDEAKTRAQRLVDGAKVALTLSVQNAESVGLRWFRKAA